jgi:hypothetical protein
MLALLNAHERDKRISFDEPSHTYTIDESSEGYTSVTTLLHTAFKPFVADEVVSNIMNGKNWLTSEYYGMNREEIKQDWTNAAILGTAMHNNIENFYNSAPYKTDGKEWQLFCQYRDSHPELKAYRTEMTVFDEDHKIAGSIDMLYMDPKSPGCYIIADWKRSKSLKMDNKWQSGLLDCTRHLDDCNFIQYSLQLNIYKHILETKYDMTVTECFLVFLHPKQQDYIKVICEDLSEEVVQLFEHRKQQLDENIHNKENIHPDTSEHVNQA